MPGGRRRWGWFLLAFGVALIVLGAVGLLLDALGMGDHAGLDPRDLAPIALGCLVAGTSVYFLGDR